MTAFVDWNAQMHNAGVLEGTAPELEAWQTFAETVRLTERALVAESERKHAGLRFLVSFRLYHGWHKGWTATDRLKAAIYVASGDIAALSKSSQVSFAPAVEYGHTLLSAVPERRHKRPPIHLPNTLRAHSRGGAPTEKMVDTALAADLLAWARSPSSEWALVLAEDDDFIPPVYTAEAWASQGGGRTLLVRRRGSSQFYKLNGILRQV